MFPTGSRWGDSSIRSSLQQIDLRSPISRYPKADRYQDGWIRGYLSYPHFHGTPKWFFVHFRAKMTLTFTTELVQNLAWYSTGDGLCSALSASLGLLSAVFQTLFRNAAPLECSTILQTFLYRRSPWIPFSP